MAAFASESIRLHALLPLGLRAVTYQNCVAVWALLAIREMKKSWNWLL